MSFSESGVSLCGNDKSGEAAPQVGACFRKGLKIEPVKLPGSRRRSRRTKGPRWRPTTSSPTIGRPQAACERYAMNTKTVAHPAEVRRGASRRTPVRPAIEEAPDCGAKSLPNWAAEVAS